MRSPFDLKSTTDATDGPPPVPRPTEGAQVGATSTFLVLFGAIFAVVGLLLVTIFTAIGGSFLDDLALDRRGVRAVATPVRSEITRSRVNRQWLYKVTWEARDASGVQRVGTLRTRGDRTAPFAIEYDPEDPARAREVGGSASVFGGFVLIPAGFALAGIVIVIVGGVMRARWRALYRDGTASRGRVLSYEPTSVRMNGQTLYRVTYSYSTPAGELTAHHRTLKTYEPGSDVWIIYDPAEPSRAMLA